MLSTSLLRAFVAAILLVLGAGAASAEDGYDLWLRYRPIEAPLRSVYVRRAAAVVERSNDATLQVAGNELRRAILDLLGRTPERRLANGAILIGTPASSRLIAGLHLALNQAGDEGYCLESVQVGGHPVTVISANRDIGVLYGAFAFVRLIQTRALPRRLHVCDAPEISVRMLDHWDNLDGTIERGYAGHSLWNWNQLPVIDPRLIDYARANASIGINGASLSNVNADARILRQDYLEKVAAIANTWRPYGIRVYLTARFSAPREIGGLATADPLDPRVRAWWRMKADEIYRLIPDFGGFLVKANSEGQPGPHDYGRSHADGANMLAEALRPHHGIVLWRAFVYSPSNDDRAKQAYEEFQPLDGKFQRNVVVQVKNGPIDFQPREPFNPLFGAMPRTRLGIEVQATKEYLGENTHLAYLGTMWSEVLRGRTARPYPYSRVMDSLSVMAGVANIGSDRNWTGSDFDQANWYAFGRLAWNPSADPAKIADEWTRMTWGNDPRLVKSIVSMMMNSREAVVDYMTPLGLAHLMGSDHHYGPAPWANDFKRVEFNPTYYARADAKGIGFDRTSSGTNAAAQYARPVARCFADLKCVPDKYLLWFHHLPWTYRMRSGATLWTALIHRYDRGVAQVEAMNLAWSKLAPMIDMQRHSKDAAKLKRQLTEANWWRDASIAYFQSVSRLLLPAAARRPNHDLNWYKAIHFDTVQGYLKPGTGRQMSCVPPEGGPPCVL